LFLAERVFPEKDESSVFLSFAHFALFSTSEMQSVIFGVHPLENDKSNFIPAQMTGILRGFCGLPV
jgi:hypothetical protein